MEQHRPRHRHLHHSAQEVVVATAMCPSALAALAVEVVAASTVVAVVPVATVPQPKVAAVAVVLAMSAVRQL